MKNPPTEASGRKFGKRIAIQGVNEQSGIWGVLTPSIECKVVAAMLVTEQREAEPERLQIYRNRISQSSTSHLDDSSKGGKSRSSAPKKRGDRDGCER